MNEKTVTVSIVVNIESDKLPKKKAQQAFIENVATLLMMESAKTLEDVISKLLKLYDKKSK